MITIAKDEKTFLKVSADQFIQSVADAIRERGIALVCVSGGSTPQKFFELLSTDYYKSRTEWAKVHFFWTDERCVPPQHPDSNFGMTKKALLDRIGIPEANIHRIPGEMLPPYEAAKAYENALRAFFRTQKCPNWFDILYLGLGEDGHTASLFPRNSALTEKERWVTASWIEHLSSNRVTLTLSMINEARKIVFMVSGDKKADIIREIFRDDRTGTYPALQIKPVHGSLEWMLDSNAAAKLPPDIRYGARHV